MYGDVEVTSGRVDDELDKILSSLDTTTFDEDDWNVICIACKSLAAVWSDLSCFLGLSADTIEDIGRNNPGNNSICLKKAFNHWIRQNYKTQKFGLPSWKTLLKAVAQLDKRLCKQLAADHQSGSDIDKEMQCTSVESVKSKTEDHENQLAINEEHNSEDTSTKSVKLKTEGNTSELCEEIVSDETGILLRCPCGEISLDHYFDDDCSASNSQSFPYLYLTKLDEDDQENLRFQLDQESKEVQASFASVFNNICASLKSRGITPLELARCALSLGAFDRDSKCQKSLLSNVKDELTESGDIEKSFIILREHMNFFNCELLEHIVKCTQVCSDGDRELFATYQKRFEHYCKRKVFEVSPDMVGKCLTKCKERQGKKFAVLIPDLSADTSLENVRKIKYRFAEVLKLKPATLYLDRIGKGSLVLVFCIPKFVAEQLGTSLKDSLKEIGCEVLSEPDTKHQGTCMVSPLESDSNSVDKETKMQAILKNKEGMAHFAEGRYELAIELFSQALESDPNSAIVLTNRARSFIKMQKYDAAEDDCSLSLSLDKYYTKAQFVRATSRILQGKIEEAQQDYLSILTLEPTNQQAKKCLGKLEVMKVKQLSKLDRYNFDIKVYTKAIEKYPDNAVYPAKRAEALINVQRYADAEYDCSKAISLDQSNVKVFHRRALARMKLGKLDDAKMDCQCAFELDPGSKQNKMDTAKLMNAIGNLHFKLHQYQDAIETYTKAMELDPESTIVPTNRAMVQLRLERYEDAERDCSRAIDLDMSNLEAYMLRADTRVKLFKLKEAREDLMVVLTFEPGNEQAWEELEKLNSDVMTLINRQSCECLNENKDHPYQNALCGTNEYLESDTDEQLILYLSFKHPVKLAKLHLVGPSDGRAPKTVNVFINQPQTLSFHEAEARQPVQKIILTEADSTIPLSCVRFRQVHDLTIYVKDNQGGQKTTIINQIRFMGEPVEAIPPESTVERVSGQVGEYCKKPTCPKEYQ